MLCWTLWTCTCGVMLWAGVMASAAESIGKWTFVEIISVPDANLLYFDFSLENRYDVEKSCNELLKTVFWNEEAVLPLQNLTIQDIAVTRTTEITYGTFLSANWTLSKSSNSFHIIYSKNHSVLNADGWYMRLPASMTLSFPERRGFHNELQIRCNYTSFFLFLPRGVYVDMDELATLPDWTFQAVPSVIDTEAPLDKASAIMLHISKKPASSRKSREPNLDIHFPIHLRYILPFDADPTHHRSVLIPPPFIRQDSQIFLANLNPVHLSVPAGSETDAIFVLPLTFLTLVLSTFLLFVKILKYRTFRSC